MASTVAGVILRQVRRLVAGRADDPAQDGDLLRDYVARRDETAFTALVRRHGPMVLSVCRSVLRQEQDAEDAFQATFLVLARKAPSIRKPAEVGSWLHGVAYRLALNARAASVRRRVHEQAAEPPRPDDADSLTWGELRQVLHEELARLPERFRAPLLLCYLEGLTQDEAARRLGWPATTLKGRLGSGRDLLRKRLARRGFALSAPLFAALFAGGQAEAVAIPAALVQGTVLGVLSGAAASAGGVSAQAVALADGLARGSFPRLLKVLLILLMVGGGVAAGVAGLRSPVPSESAAPEELAQAAPEEPVQAAPEEPQQAAPPDDAPVPAPKETPAKADADPLPKGALARLGTRRLRHAGDVNSVAFSPDGKLLLSAGSDGMVYLWDPATGKRVRQIEQHYYTATFSPDGEWLAAVKDSTSIVLHEVFVGENKRTIGTAKGTVLALAFSPDGKLLVSADQHAGVTLWDVAAGEQRRHFALPPQTVCTSLSFSPDGKLLAAASMKGDAHVWNPTTGEERYRLPAAAMTFSPDGKLLAAAHTDGAVLLLEAMTGKELGKLAGGPSQFPGVAFSPDGTLLAAGGEDVLRLFDVARREQLHQVPSAPGSYHKVAFSPDGKALAWTAGYAVRVWDVRAWKERFPLDGPTTQIDTLAYSPDGKTLAAGGTHDHRVLLWDVATCKERLAFDCGGAGVRSIAFAPDGKSLAAGLTRHTGSDAATAVIWETESGKSLLRIAHGNPGNAIAFSGDGKLLAVGDPNITIWDTSNGRQRGYYHPPATMVHSLAFTPRDRSLLFTSYSLPLSQCDLAIEKEVRKFESGSLAYLRMALTPTRRYVAVGLRTNAGSPPRNPILIWEVATGKQVGALCPDESLAESVAFSPDGRLVACLRYDRSIRVTDVLTGEELRRFEDPSLPMTIAFSPDGTTIASAGWGTTITLWDVKDLTRRKSPHADTLLADRLADLWSDLEGADGTKAYAAVRALARVPDQAVPLIRGQLARPAPAAEKIAKLIADLDDEGFEVRERASAELAKAGAGADTALRRALASTPSAEVRKRIEALLAKLPTPGVFSAEEITAARALEVLELAGSPEARRLIRSLAEGTAWVPVTEAARDARERLGR